MYWHKKYRQCYCIYGASSSSLSPRMPTRRDAYIYEYIYVTVKIQHHEHMLQIICKYHKVVMKMMRNALHSHTGEVTYKRRNLQNRQQLRSFITHSHHSIVIRIVFLDCFSVAEQSVHRENAKTQITEALLADKQVWYWTEKNRLSLRIAKDRHLHVPTVHRLRRWLEEGNGAGSTGSEAARVTPARIGRRIFSLAVTTPQAYTHGVL